MNWFHLILIMIKIIFLRKLEHFKTANVDDYLLFLVQQIVLTKDINEKLSGRKNWKQNVHNRDAHSLETIVTQ